MKKVIILLVGLCFVGIGLLSGIENPFVMLVLAFIGLLILSQLRDKPKIKYLGERTTHVWGIKKK